MGTIKNKMNQSAGKEKEALLTAVIITVCLVLAQHRFCLWENGDDVLLANVLNGIYAEENYCIFVSPILSVIVTFIDRIFPYADGVALLAGFLATNGFVCLFYILSSWLKRKNVYITAGYLIAISWLFTFLHPAFTSFTAELAFFGLFFCVCWIRKKAGNVFLIIGLIYLFFSMIWRFQAFLIMLPFVILILLADYLLLKPSKRKIYSKRVATMLIPFALILVVVAGYKMLVNGTEKNAEGLAYNKARVNLIDYPRQNWEDVKDQLENIGVSKNDYALFKAMILADTDRITTEYLQNVGKISQKNLSQKAKEFQEIRFPYFLESITTSKLFKEELILLFALFVMLLFTKVNIIRKLAALCAFLGGFAICLFFTFMGHIMYYVTQSVIWGILLVVSLNFMAQKRKARFSNLFTACWVIGAGVLLGLNVGNIQKHRPSNILAPFSAKKAEFTEVELMDGQEDTMYVWNVYLYMQRLCSSLYYHENKLLTQEFLEHNIVAGEWQYGQPYYLEYMDRIAMQNPMKALIDREHTYLVGDEETSDFILTYMHEHYDENITMEKCSDVSGFAAWKFVK